jgi:hypothetical protein
MRVFRTMADILLSSKRPKPVKILGNMFIASVLLLGSAGSLVSSSH